MTNNELMASIIIALIPTGFGIKFVYCTFVKSAIDKYLDKKIETKISCFETNTCIQKHKEVDEVKHDIKELKKSVNSIALSLVSIETAIQIYFGLPPREKEKNDNSIS